MSNDSGLISASSSGGGCVIIIDSMDYMFASCRRLGHTYAISSKHLSVAFIDYQPVKTEKDLTDWRGLALGKVGFKKADMCVKRNMIFRIRSNP